MLSGEVNPDHARGHFLRAHLDSHVGCSHPSQLLMFIINIKTGSLLRQSVIISHRSPAVPLCLWQWHLRSVSLLPLDFGETLQA